MNLRPDHPAHPGRRGTDTLTGPRLFVAGRCARTVCGAPYVLARPEDANGMCSKRCRQRAAVTRNRSAAQRANRREQAKVWAAQHVGQRCPACAKIVYANQGQVNAAVARWVGYGSPQEPYDCPVGFGLHLRTVRDEAVRSRRRRQAARERKRAQAVAA